MQMEALSKDNYFPKVVEAYSHPTRIVRGKDVDADMDVLLPFGTKEILSSLNLSLILDM